MLYLSYDYGKTVWEIRSMVEIEGGTNQDFLVQELRAGINQKQAVIQYEELLRKRYAEARDPHRL